MVMILVLVAIIVGSVGLDQLTKFLAVRYLQPVGSYPLWRGVLHLTYVENRGAAFGMLSNQRWVFMVFSSIAIVGLTVYLFRFCRENRWVKVAIAMIIGGGIGNMIDRICRGYVVDMFDLEFMSYPIFNLADCFVVVGVILGAVYYLWFYDKYDGRKAKHDDGADSVQ